MTNQNPNGGSDNQPINRLKKNLPNIAPSNKNQGSGGDRLVGVGLDNKDGHKRITKGDQFTLAGGSQRTHDAMTETVVKTMEDLKKKGRSLNSADPKEVMDLLHKNTPREG